MIFNKKLLNDDFYYGKARDAAVSASNINSILEGTFGQKSEWKIAFEVGKYFHCLTLEPEKLEDFEIQDVPRRKAGDKYLKQTEVDMCKAMKTSHDSDAEARGICYGPGVLYEIPGHTIIEEVLFIGKCDIYNPQIGYLGDLKSTSNLYGFNGSIDKWYTSQLWVYWKIFGLPTAYIAVDKKTLETQVIEPEKHYYAAGKSKVLKAIDIYKEVYPEHYKRNLELQEQLKQEDYV